MKRIPTLLIAVALPLAFATPSIAQDSKTLGTVTTGNTTIEFKSAGTSDLAMDKLTAWSEFASQHPDISKDLAYHPSLVDNDSFVAKHPELKDFFAQHPDIRQDMAANPGNYNAIPPRPGE